MEIFAILLLALACASVFYRRDNEKLEQATSKAEAVQYGCGSMLWILVIAVTVVTILLAGITANQDFLLPGR